MEQPQVEGVVHVGPIYEPKSVTWTVWEYGTNGVRRRVTLPAGEAFTLTTEDEGCYVSAAGDFDVLYGGDVGVSAS